MMLQFWTMNNPAYPFIENLDEVLERLGGNEALLMKLLGKFGTAYRESGAELIRLLREGQREEAYRLVHSIKGVSSNLGIGALYRSAIELEQKMKSGAYDPLLPETVAFCAELDVTLKYL
ncbi:MAG TPA: Hpt domain-containing protein [Treponemataceae bacterium]|jgi:HPt (histidine-containing phosphotransfer) domain-containing protein|nr:Hpt domain-containing protein [Treponemataceae bacterium]HPX47581.1 Hpt domain-containing protein [Treponemataceae bacterium]